MYDQGIRPILAMAVPRVRGRSKAMHASASASVIRQLMEPLCVLPVGDARSRGSSHPVSHFGSDCTVGPSCLLAIFVVLSKAIRITAARPGQLSIHHPSIWCLVSGAQGPSSQHIVTRRSPLLRSKTCSALASASRKGVWMLAEPPQITIFVQAQVLCSSGGTGASQDAGRLALCALAFVVGGDIGKLRRAFRAWLLFVKSASASGQTRNLSRLSGQVGLSAWKARSSLDV